MVFGAITGTTNLKNEVFCLTEERDFLRSKLLESVSEMTALQEELRAQKRQVDRLRRQLMEGGTVGSLVLSSTPKSSPSLEKEVEEETTSSTSSEDVSSTAHASHEEDDNDDDADSAKDIRQSAEKLLQWASYQSSMRTTTAPPTPDHSSAASVSDLVRHPIQSITLSSNMARQEDDANSQHSDWEEE